MDGLSTQELRRLHDVLDPTVEPEAGDLIGQQVLEVIADLMRSDVVSLQVMNHRQHKLLLQRTAPAPDDSDGGLRALFWSGFAGSGCSYPQRTGDMHILWSGYSPPSTPEAGAIMREFGDAMPWQDEVVVPLESHDADDHRLLLFRNEGPKYSERDILVLSLVRAAVAQRHARQVYRSSARSSLTARQVEILRLVADGSTNRQIARALTISEGTTRTHLANIYTKLGASNRTQALAVAGLLT
jgi:DNA-binding CsgD family transcriptional regulator